MLFVLLTYSLNNIHTKKLAITVQLLTPLMLGALIAYVCDATYSLMSASNLGQHITYYTTATSHVE